MRRKEAGGGGGASITRPKRRRNGTSLRHPPPPILLLLLQQLLLLGTLMLQRATAASAASSASLAELKPFQVLGEWLDRSDDSDLRGAGPRNIERAFKVVASSQQALKTMDGAAHGLYAYSHVRPPMKAWSRLEYSRSTKAEKEERLKAFRKAKLLEEAVYSSELAELTADGLDRNDSLACVSDLQSRQTVLLEDFATVDRGKFRFLLLADPDSRRLTLSIGDAMGWAEKLDIIRAPPLAVPLRSRGLLRHSMNVNPRLWKAAVAILDKVRPVLATALKDSHAGYGLHIVGFSLGAGVGALVGGVLDGAIAVHGSTPPPLARKKGGHRGGEGLADAAPDSAPAGDAAAAAVMPGTSPAPPSPPPRAWLAATGMVRDNVTTFVFAPPPCISKGVRGLHRFTTSFVLGTSRKRAGCMCGRPSRTLIVLSLFFSTPSHTTQATTWFRVRRLPRWSGWRNASWTTSRKMVGGAFTLTTPGKQRRGQWRKDGGPFVLMFLSLPLFFPSSPTHQELDEGRGGGDAAAGGDAPSERQGGR